MATQDEIDRGDVLEDEDIEEGDMEEEVEEEEDVEDEDEDEEGDDEEEESEEDEDDGDDEEEDGEEDEDDDEEEDDHRIPLSRLNRALAQRDQEKERVNWLEEQLEKLIERGALPAKEEKVVDPYDFSKAESSYIDFVLEGEVEKAAALRATIIEEQRKELISKIESASEKAAEKATTASQEEREEERFNVAIDNLENKFPFLDNSSDDYNEEAVETVNTLMTGYMATGMAKSKALKIAVEKVSPLYEKAPLTKDGKRKKTARKRNVEAMKKQPPKGRSKKTRDVDENVNVDKMSEKDFRGLTKKEKAILRGDIVG